MEIELDFSIYEYITRRIENWYQVSNTDRKDTSIYKSVTYANTINRYT